ncbi:hypothetical protein SAMN05877753_102671 [Bacillus oleivorans]|uniref:Uncharacterized protein n=1 Tax=Bacillus oleivorans TaxID=1448271 RepID=A0A285CMP1_9BACI|nr:hypothetical protein [Bacillus oleivorans]SNX68695.1 hypothetical protein SAMN05877753_102671 [Bacillus oleivorans]
MKKFLLLFVLIIISYTCLSCNVKTTKRHTDTDYSIGNPTVDEILEDNRNADLFLFNQIVYTNAEDLEWVKAKELTIGEEVLVISKQTNDRNKFDDGAATKLPVGTKIYKPVESGNILVAIVDRKEIRYLGLREG